jgi:hypothetical protein
MTDLCDEEEAEKECHDSVRMAEESDPTNPEAKQTKARLLLIKSDFEVFFLVGPWLIYVFA